MNKRTEKMLSNFTDKELRYILQYAQSHLKQSFDPNDGTLQGDILDRINKVIEDAKK